MGCANLLLPIVCLTCVCNARAGLSTPLAKRQIARLLTRILDGVADEHGGVQEGGNALRTALRQQDLTRR